MFMYVYWCCFILLQVWECYYIWLHIVTCYSFFISFILHIFTCYYLVSHIITYYYILLQNSSYYCRLVHISTFITYYHILLLGFITIVITTYFSMINMFLYLIIKRLGYSGARSGSRKLRTKGTTDSWSASEEFCIVEQTYGISCGYIPMIDRYIYIYNYYLFFIITTIIITIITIIISMGGKDLYGRWIVVLPNQSYMETCQWGVVVIKKNGD